MATFETLALSGAALVASAAALPAAAQSTQTPPELADLVGARAAGAETQMQARGWNSAGSTQAQGATWTYWWNGRSCVQVATRDGRYASIGRVPEGSTARFVRDGTLPDDTRHGAGVYRMAS